MTHDELLAKAVEHLKKFEARLPERLRDVTVDRLPKRRFRDAVVIDFEGEKESGSIRVVVERDTGQTISAEMTPPKNNVEEA